MDPKFLKPYDPAGTEKAVYERWEESGFFNPDNLPGERKDTFSMVLPPPNVTGILHMGSALMLVIEDIFVRHARMQGKRALWIPGTDSAAIATQARVEKDIQKSEGKSRHDLGREELLKRIDTFVEENKNTIVSQVRSLGASLDWSRYAYTMDEKHYRAVMEAFVRMYDAGLIYRGNRIVNWDPKGQTTISDDEIVYEERKAKLYTFRYSKDFPVPISTTRPETKVGDVAVAVHPDDERYAKFVDKEFDLIFSDVPLHIKIIADKSVEKEFGTGALGVTPAHSHIDWEIAERHDLPHPQVINEYAKMSVEGRLNGKKTLEAREMVVEWLRAEGLLEKEEEVDQNISTAERTGGIVEPLPKLQWWMDVDKPFTLPHSEIPGIPSGGTTTLKEMMRKAVESGEVKFVSERFERTYLNWVDNLRDWCLSRQIWFGHRIPVWYKTEVGTDMEAVHFKEDVFSKKLGLTEKKTFDQFSNELLEKNNWKDKNIQWKSQNGVLQLYIGYVNILKQLNYIDDFWMQQNRIDKPKKEAEIHVGEKPPTDIGWYQDPDVLDTWFSSGLWTFSTMGWPEKTDDLKRFHPTSMIETGYDIIPLWVSRMILMSGFHLGQVPFRTVYIHGLVRDGQGRKVSKSLGNNIDPIEMGAKYGTDAVRVSLIAGMAPGTDSRISEEKIRGYKHFANKIWNIARFVLENIEGMRSDAILAEADTALLKEMEEAVRNVSEHIEKYRIDLAFDALYHFVWDRFAAEIIEESKVILKGEDGVARTSRQRALYAMLLTSLKLLHPFMPFVTEEIWASLPKKENELLMVAEWPSQ